MILALAGGALFGAAGCGETKRTVQNGERPRVVSLHDVTAEIVIALDARDRLVGVAEPVNATESTKRLLADVPRVAGLESILLTRPTAVVGLEVVREQDPELVARLAERGIDVYLPGLVVLDDVHAMTRAIGERMGAVPEAEDLIARFQRRIRLGSTSSSEPKRVFVYDCCDPPFTAGGGTVLTEIISRAGGKNIFAGLEADWTHVSWEEVVLREPELIVVHAYEHEGQGDVRAKKEVLGRIPDLAELPTTTLPLGGSLGGLRSAETLERLRGAIGDRS